MSERKRKPPSRRKLPGRHKAADGGVVNVVSDALRLAAETLYVTDVMAQMSVRDVAALPQFRALSLRTIEAWAAEDQWVARRRERIAQFRQGLEDRLHNQIIQAQVDSLKRMEGLYDKSMAFALSVDGPAPRSFEQVGILALRLHDHIHRVRMDMLDKMMPQAAATQPEVDADAEAEARQAVPDASVPDLSMEEAHAVAHTIMRMRQGTAGVPPPAPSAAGATVLDAAVPLGDDGQDADVGYGGGEEDEDDEDAEDV